ncbi:MAG: DUF484 family protein [Gammaproteobacteria bacterium]|nr:DUF484 family protein [Gammaproteobacteria bacterium]
MKERTEQLEKGQDDPGELDKRNEREVAEYLHHHPDFFSRHEALLLQMTLPHPQNGQAISLVERQLSVMREQKQQLREQLQRLTLAARTNEQLMGRFQQMILCLIDSDDLEQAISYIRDALHEDFHADKVELLLFDATERDNRIARDDARLQPLARILEGRRTVCGHLRPEQLALLFGEGSLDIASAVVIPLCEEGSEPCLGLLAIGSIDANRYHPQMGTMFVNHLGAVMNRIFRAHLGA